MTQPNNPHDQQNFNIAEITEAMGGLDPQMQQTVLGGLGRVAEQRRAERQDHKFQMAVFSYAVCYKRVGSDSASDHAIESWVDQLDDSSAELLDMFAGRPADAQLSKLEEQALDAAAATYAYEQLIHGDDINKVEQVINRAGVTTEHIKQMFDEAAVQINIQDGLSEQGARHYVDERYRTIDDFGEALTQEPGARYWTQIIGVRGDALVQSLQQAGYTLPELGRNGRYPGEDDHFPIFVPLVRP